MDGSDPNNPPAAAPGGAFARKRREKEERAASAGWPVQPAAPAPVPPAAAPVPPAHAATPETPAPTPAASVDVPPSPAPAPAVDHEPVAEPEPAIDAVTPDATPLIRQAPDPVEDTSPAEPDTDADERAPYEEPAAATSAPTHRAEPLPDLSPAVRQTATATALTDTTELGAIADEPPKHTKAPRAAKKARAPKEPKAPKQPNTPKASEETADTSPRGGRLVGLIASLVAGACSGGLLVGLVYAFNRWGGQTDSVNAFELLAAFVAAIVVGYVVLAICRTAHRAAVSFLGVGIVAVVLMFFPSDRWQTIAGSIIVVAATAVAYAVADAIAREATSEH